MIRPKRQVGGGGGENHDASDEEGKESLPLRRSRSAPKRRGGGPAGGISPRARCSSASNVRPPVRSQVASRVKRDPANPAPAEEALCRLVCQRVERRFQPKQHRPRHPLPAILLSGQRRQHAQRGRRARWLVFAVRSCRCFARRSGRAERDRDRPNVFCREDARRLLVRHACADLGGRRTSRACLLIASSPPSRSRSSKVRAALNCAPRCRLPSSIARPAATPTPTPFSRPRSRAFRRRRSSRR